MSNMVKNATIIKTEIGELGRGFCSFITLEVQGMGSREKFGGYRLSAGDCCYDYIHTICEAIGVSTWEGLVNQRCRVRYDGQTLVGIGNFMEERWFDLAQFQALHKDDVAMQAAKR